MYAVKCSFLIRKLCICVLAEISMACIVTDLPACGPAGKSSPFSMPSAPAPMYMRAMSFPSHLMIPESVFGSDALLQPARSAQKPAPRLPPKGSPVEYPVDFPPVSSSESNSDHSSGLSPRAGLPQRPSSKCVAIPFVSVSLVKASNPMLMRCGEALNLGHPSRLSECLTRNHCKLHDDMPVYLQTSRVG